jgi:nitrate reductase gamma subunit
MRDELLFVVAPRLAALCCVAGLVLVGLMSHRRNSRQPSSTSGGESSVALSRVWRYSLALVLVGHVVAFAFPGTVLLWDRQPSRLIVLESIGLAAAIVALVSLFLMSARWHRSASSFDTIAATLVILQVISGLTVAVRYRWASSWAEVTLAPYLHSLLGPSPTVILVSRMPFVVQLHVFCAFAILAIVPLGRVGNLLIAAVEQRGAALSPVLPLSRSGWRAVPAWTAIDVPVAAEIRRDDSPTH